MMQVPTNISVGHFLASGEALRALTPDEQRELRLFPPYSNSRLTDIAERSSVRISTLRRWCCSSDRSEIDTLDTLAALYPRRRSPGEMLAIGYAAPFEVSNQDEEDGNAIVGAFWALVFTAIGIAGVWLLLQATGHGSELMQYWMSRGYIK